MSERASSLVTILFTDLVNSTELLARAGDEAAQRIFRAHHDLLARTASAHGGEEVKWLGDGLMVVFPSAAEAVRCAIAMQQAAHRPVLGERLVIRVGLNAGEALRDTADYFGTPVVIARRLCDRATGGQILCSELVAGLLSGRAGSRFGVLGPLELKGVPQPVETLEVAYDVEPERRVAHLPFVGRNHELAHLVGLLGDAAAGRGGLVFVVGEPGIGKTRLTEELAEQARHDGFSVLWGHCFEGDWAPPYTPFAEAIEALVVTTEPQELRADLGTGGPALAQLVNALRAQLPDLPAAAPVEPNEERFRLLDAVAQLLVARARRAALLVCLEDLHWADHSTIALLRHLARLVPTNRVLVVGTYRDAEVRTGHPLHDAFGSLRREVEFERLKLRGLETKAVNDMLGALAEHELAASVAAAITTETDGNPFFIKEVLRHLVEEGRFIPGATGHSSAERPVAELGIPEGVREVIGRRFARLSANCNKLLMAASVFEGDTRLEVVAAVAGLDEEDALDALDEALDAQLLRPSGSIDVYTFTHAIIRHSLLEELSPSRRARLHLRAADALWVASAEPSPARWGEIASQYHRVAGLGGAERGVEPALAAADHAEATGAHDEAARFLRMALDLLPAADPRRPRLLGRLGVALAWARDFDGAAKVVSRAGSAIADAEGAEAAVQYLSSATYDCAMAGGVVQAWELARQGLTYASTCDVAWARLVSFDHERRAAEDPEHPGIPLDSPERHQSARILRDAHLDPLAPAPMEAVFDSRQDALSSSNLGVLSYWAGEYTRCVPLLAAEAEEAEALGRLFRAARARAFLCCCQIALGCFDDARRSLAQARALADRLGTPVVPLVYAQGALCLALDEGWAELADIVEPLSTSTNPALAWGLGCFAAMAAQAAAFRGRAEEALGFLQRVVPWLIRSPAWAPNLPGFACHASSVLWLFQRLDYADAIEAALRDKLLVADFRSPMLDGRLALARICALTGRHDEAVTWFAEARQVLTEQGARPLGAIASFDEALMHLRRGDLTEAAPHLDTACREFEELGMTGWIRRSDGAARRLSGGGEV